MMKTPFLNRDVGSGMLFAAFGILGLWFGRGYDLGTSMQMGYGYFPRLLSILLLGFGLIIAGKGIIVGGGSIERIHLRPMLLVTAALVAFSFILSRYGLLPAAFVLVFVGAAGGSEFKFKEILPLAIALACCSAFVFIYLLGIPLKYLSF